MCSRHDDPSMHENTHPDDTFCDLCLKRVYDGSLRAQTIGRSTAFVCGSCRDKARERYEREVAA